MSSAGELILLSSISGLDIIGCAQRLCDYEQPTKPSGPIKVENILIEEASKSVEGTDARPSEGYQMVDVLSLPLSELSSLCDRSWTRMLEQVVTRPDQSSRFSIGTFHPVLYHQVTSEFAEPYLAGKIQSITNEYRSKDKAHVKWIVSIHDDIYDIYRKLMQPGKLFDPRRRESRNPIDDIADLRMILDWRDRELAAARAMAVSLDAKHLLFHRKGRLNSLGQILFENKPCIYYSHPISQPRRDIANKVVKGKNETPDPKRGQELIQAIQSFADHLALFAAIVEPTAIDEARLDTGNLGGLMEADLAGTIAPPLTNRWPIGEGMRLGGDPSTLNSENTTRLLRLSNGALAALQSVKTTNASLEGLKSSIELLLKEIMRQINVRDRVLASQADIIVVFRPFSLPDSSDPTGGVEAEIETITNSTLSRRCKPHLIVVHPRKDELRRRGNEFKKIWEATVAEHYHGDNDVLAQLKTRCHDELSGPNSVDTSIGLESLLKTIINGPLLSARPKVRVTSMSKGPLIQDAEVRRAFISSLCSVPPGAKESTILKSTLAQQADASDGAVVFVDTPEFCQRLIQLVSRAIASFNNSGTNPSARTDASH